MTETKKHKGVVKWFSDDRGYGFIMGDDTIEYFVHYNEIQMEGFKHLMEGQKVEFISAKDEQGREKATQVKIII